MLHVGTEGQEHEYKCGADRGESYLIFFNFNRNE